MSTTARNTRVLVTGGSGFIGTNLVQYYLDRGAQVVNIDIRPPRNPDHTHVWFKQDILEKNALSELLCGFSPDYVFHMAARTDLNGKTIDDYAANTIGVSNLVEIANELPGIQRVIYASSMLVCRLGYRPESFQDYCPPNAYGESKVLAERIVRDQSRDGVPWVIVRPTSIWGPWFDVPYKSFFSAIQKGLYFHPKGETITRSYGFILNTVYQLDRVAHIDMDNLVSRTLYLADYEPINLREWGEMIRIAMHARRIWEIPVPILRGVALFGDLLSFLGNLDPPLTSRRLGNLLTNAIFDLTDLEEVCPELPYGTQQGVALTVEWMRKNGT